MGCYGMLWENLGCYGMLWDAMKMPEDAMGCGNFLKDAMGCGLRCWVPTPGFKFWNPDGAYFKFSIIVKTNSCKHMQNYLASRTNDNDIICDS